MPTPWVLVLEQPSEGDPARSVAGLPLALRLALDAQAAGASAIVAPDSPWARVLVDARLRAAVVPVPPPGCAAVRVGATMVVHRRLLADAAQRGDLATDVDVLDLRLDPTTPFPFDPILVASPAAAAVAERALFRALRKREDGWTSRWMNRYVSLAISRWLVKTPLTPNQVSVAILFVGLAGAALASRGTYAALAAGAALFHAQSILDGCDGEMSRVTHRGSLLGEWLDTVGDDVTNYGFFGAAAYGLWSTSHEPIWAVAGLVTVGSGVVASGIEYRYLVEIGSGDLLKYPLSQGTSNATGPLSVLQPLFKRDTFVLLTLVAALVGQLGPMLVVFSIAALGILVSVIATELRLAREKRR